VEVTETVRQKHGIVPGGRKSPFLGLWKKELGQLQKALRTHLAQKKEYEQLEAAREEWTRRGPPWEHQKRYMKGSPLLFTSAFTIETGWQRRKLPRW